MSKNLNFSEFLGNLSTNQQNRLLVLLAEEKGISLVATDEGMEIGQKMNKVPQLTQFRDWLRIQQDFQKTVNTKTVVFTSVDDTFLEQELEKKIKETVSV
jgi:hypothetical protein